MDYEIHYRSGVSNKAADALSRVAVTNLNSLVHSVTTAPDLLAEVQGSIQTHRDYQTITQRLLKGDVVPNYTLEQGILKRKGRVVVGPDKELKKRLMALYHDGVLGGHSGSQATFKRLISMYYWPGMEQYVRQYVRECTVCQRHKYENIATPGLLQPLPLPEGCWTDISLDFIEGLPKSHGKEVIMVVVDRLSKYGHFVALAPPYTALEVARAYLDHVYKLHGLLNSMVSDRDPIFVSNFGENSSGYRELS